MLVGWGEVVDVGRMGVEPDVVDAAEVLSLRGTSAE